MWDVGGLYFVVFQVMFRGIFVVRSGLYERKLFCFGMCKANAVSVVCRSCCGCSGCRGKSLHVCAKGCRYLRLFMGPSRNGGNDILLGGMGRDAARAGRLGRVCKG